MSSRVLSLAAALSLALVAPAFAAQSPEALVKQVYKPEALTDDIAKDMAKDLGAAYTKDGSNPDEVGEIDFDWRYGTQETDIKNLVFSTGSDAWGPTVTAKFINEGQPGTVTWHFCKAADGSFRIGDVNSPDQDGWSLRKMLKLDPDKVDC